MRSLLQGKLKTHLQNQSQGLSGEVHGKSLTDAQAGPGES